ncbi:MAG TPA: DUF3310 domain-containing protein [Methanosarcina sp.]|nr:DUF3310 domain-containing protein [Methanosarcina sp.]
MSSTEKEMKAEIEEMYREVPNHEQSQFMKAAEEMAQNMNYDRQNDIYRDAPMKPHGIEVQNYQVGGNHYAKHKIQPWNVIDEYGLNFYEGNALKYLLRRKGNRLEDLQKAKHYIEKLIDDETKANTR